LCKLEKLEEFDVSMNNLEGILPSCINNLTSLRLLDLSMNKFSGNISSSWIASLKSLQYIDLSHNKFEGVFSFSSLANHSQLQVVRFTCDDYKLQITEISGWIPLFQLQFLVLSNCLKKLSTEIPEFLFHQHNLRLADLSHNKLKGRFPGWLLENNTRLEYLSLRDNSFLGPFHLPPRLNLSISWMDVSANQFDGQLQENIGNLLPNIKTLDLSRNAFEGRLPSSIGNMSGMEKLDVSFNNFSGVVPKELVADCSKLQVLKLSRNNFHGDLFSTQFNLTRLQLLDFSDNQFSGTLSKKLLKFAPVFLDGSNNHLSGKIPSWICNNTIIETLILRYNFFRGHFQCESSRLEFLDLSHNFLSGSLPSWSGVDFLKHIHFQGNMFSGSIPKAFINALINGSNIVTLDIRENNLSGSIPSILGAVSTLRVLLLNGNSFGGLIPAQLCRLIQVSIMDLSNNNFSGSIPRCFHYITFGESYYDYASMVGVLGCKLHACRSDSEGFSNS
jgi:Leucine-rich repeat (LRR) protein